MTIVAVTGNPNSGKTSLIELFKNACAKPLDFHSADQAAALSYQDPNISRQINSLLSSSENGESISNPSQEKYGDMEGQDLLMRVVNKLRQLYLDAPESLDSFLDNLEKIIHPWIGQERQKFFEKIGAKTCPDGVSKIPSLEQLPSHARHVIKDNQKHPSQIWEFKKNHHNSGLVLCEVPLLFEKNLANNFDFIIYTEQPFNTRKERGKKRGKHSDFLFETMEKRFLPEETKKLLLHEVSHCLIDHNHIPLVVEEHSCFLLLYKS